MSGAVTILISFSVLCLDNLIRVSGQFLQQIIGSRSRIDAYPVLGRLVVRIADTIILRLQILDTFRLAFERDDGEIVAVEE